MELHMTTSIIGLFENGDIARKVADALIENGIEEDMIAILEGVSASKISGSLIEAGYQEEQAERYAKAMRNGGALIVAEAPDDEADDALDTMRGFHALTPEALTELLEKRSSEEAGKAKPKAKAIEAKPAESKPAAPERSKSRQNEEAETQSAQVIEEELEVGVARTTGGKRLEVSVSEREVQETVTLHSETVEVERTRAHRTLSPEEADKAFQERTIEMVEISEKPVVSKQAHVIEEVSLNKTTGEREVVVSGTVRRQDVTVEDIDGKSNGSRKS
jgi:stress response protein YsnF